MRKRFPANARCALSDASAWRSSIAHNAKQYRAGFPQLPGFQSPPVALHLTAPSVHNQTVPRLSHRWTTILFFDPARVAFDKHVRRCSPPKRKKQASERHRRPSKTRSDEQRRRGCVFRSLRYCTSCPVGESFNLAQTSPAALLQFEIYGARVEEICVPFSSYLSTAPLRLMLTEEFV
jgi:hypothetical protein